MSPWPLQRQCVDFYGNPRSRNFEAVHITAVNCPWDLVYEGRPVHNNIIRINRKCADSLMRVLNAVWDALEHDQEAINAHHYNLFSGSYVFRPMRGGRALSMHAYGCAIDWDDENNEHHARKHMLQSDSLLIEQFKAEGWEWGGDWRWPSVDAMHVQAARTK